MFYEIRTYDLKPRAVSQFARRTSELLAKRQEYSVLFGFWHTEIGPLNQVVHIWQYEDLKERASIRGKVKAEGIWPPNNNEFIANMQTEIMLPAKFMPSMNEGKLGPIYEMRTYTYAAGDVDKVLAAWEDVISDRVRLSPLVGCWYGEIGQLNKFVHMWAYTSFEERTRVREESAKLGIWPPKSGVLPLRQENKILLPFDFSPLQ